MSPAIGRQVWRRVGDKVGELSFALENITTMDITVAQVKFGIPWDIHNVRLGAGASRRGAHTLGIEVKRRRYRSRQVGHEFMAVSDMKKSRHRRTCGRT